MIVNAEFDRVELGTDDRELASEIQSILDDVDA